MAKIALYAICKNESRNVAAFLETAKEADYIFVVDTGSSDATLDEFVRIGTELGLAGRLELGTAEFVPFKFDVARNFAMNATLTKFPDADILVFLDLDETFEPGWADKLRSSHTEGNYSIQTVMNLKDKNGNTTCSYFQTKAHTPTGFTWMYSIHEVLVAQCESTVLLSDIQVYHNKDESKDRTLYLTLLASDFADNVDDHRCTFYYGRELYYAGRYREAAHVLLTASSQQVGYFPAQHIEVLRTLHYCTHDPKYLYEALALNPSLVDLYYELALHCRDTQNYYGAIGMVDILLKIEPSDNFILFSDPSVLQYKAYDLLCECFWHIGDVQNSYQNAIRAYAANPRDERLRENVLMFVDKFNIGAQSADPNQHQPSE